MYRKSIYILTGLCLAGLFSSSVVEACRFWVAVGDNIQNSFISNQLIDQPNSLKNLGETHSDGWSVGFYDGADEIIIRGDEASSFNQEFDDAVRYSGVLQPDIVMAHLRRASSGCVDGVPNPHPFKIKYNNRNWLFGHNGGMRKQVLIDLIGEDFLEQFPPSVCTYDPPASWIDSELYFILVMKSIKEADDDVEAGILSTLRKLYSVLPKNRRYLNFFLSDGQSVWVFRKGNTLFYKFNPDTQLTVVASSVPEADPGEWMEFPEDTLAVIAPKSFPKFIQLQ